MIIKAFSKEYNDYFFNAFVKGEKYIWINGVFDIFHIEHLRMINYAKEVFPNHKLIIGVNSDKSVFELNKSHPLIFDEKYRSEFLNELCDLVIIYDTTDELIKMLDTLKPDFIIKGEEYKYLDIPEKKLDINIIYYFSKSDLSSTNIYNNIIKKFKGLSR